MENIKNRTKSSPSNLLIYLFIFSFISILWIFKELIAGMLIIGVSIVLGAYLLIKIGSTVISILLTLFFASGKVLIFILAIGSIVGLLSLF